MSNEIRPWQRQPTDTNKSFAAFCIYRDMGGKRSLAKAYTAYKKDKDKVKIGDEILEAPTFFTDWSTAHNWQERVAAYDEYQDTARQERKLQAKKEIEDNVLSDYRVLREAIEKYIHDYADSSFAGVKPYDIANLISMMKQADDYARRAVGLPDRITENKNEHTGKDGGAIQTANVTITAESAHDASNILKQLADLGAIPSEPSTGDNDPAPE